MDGAQATVIASEEDDGFIIEAPATCLLVFPGDLKQRDRVWLNHQWDFQPLATQDAEAVVVVPQGRHHVRFERRPQARNMAVWWGTSILPALLCGLVVVLLERLLRPKGRLRKSRLSPLGLRKMILLMVLVAVPWSWLLITEQVANDYGWIQLTQEQTWGMEKPWFDHGEIPEALLATSESPIFRVVHHTLYALELLPFGPSGWWLHLWGIIYQGLVAVLIYALLRRWYPKGAFIGALLGAIWPVAAQALAWNAARCLSMSHAAGLAALICSLRYMNREGGRFGFGAACLLWCAVGLKETGLAYGAVVGGLPLLLNLKQLDVRRLLCLYGGLASVAILYGLVRWALGYGAPVAYHGVTFSSPLTAIQMGADQLHHALIGGMSATFHPMIEGFAIPGTDMSTGWQNHASLGLAALILLMGCVSGGRRGWTLLILGAVTTAIVALPDIVWLLNHRSVSANRLYYVVPLFLWPIIWCPFGEKVHRSTSQAMVVLAGILLFALLGLVILGHCRNGYFRHEMAEVGMQWIQGCATTLDELEDQELPSGFRDGAQLSGPPACFIIGKPDRPHLGEAPLLGVTVSGYVQPPYTRRRRHGDTAFAREGVGAHINRPSAIPAMGHTLDDYPWAVWVLESFLPADDEAVEDSAQTEPRRLPPVHVGTLPALGAPLPQTHTLAARSGAGTGATFTVPLSGRPLRSLAAVELRFPRDLPAETRLTLTPTAGGVPGTESSLQVRAWLPAEQPVRIPVRGVSDWALVETLGDLVLSISGSPHLEVPTVEATLLAELPALQVVAPKIGQVMAFGDPFPELAISDPETPWGYRITLTGHGERAPHNLNSSYVLPRGAFHQGEDGVLRLDILKQFGIPTEQWVAGIEALKNSLEDYSGFMLWVEVSGVSGPNGPAQSHADAVPIKISFE